MKIAIVNLASSGLSGGYLKYLLNLVPLLRRDPRVTTLDVFIPDGVALPGCGSLRTWPARDGVTGFPALRAELARLAPDVVLFPTARLVDCGGVPTVVMVRNMEPLTVPFGGNSWRESLRNLARARAARRACERATRVIAVSDYVRRFVTGRWGLSASRVGRVYHGVTPPDPASEMAPASLQPVERFVFTAGSIRPARGLEDLIRATPALLRDHPGLAVVIAGKVDEVAHAYGARMQHLAAKLGVARAVVWTGQLSSPEMAWAYARCAAFVVTSRAEACPNVALEALSHGAPVVSTSQDPMPEFFADTATYYRPEKPDELVSRVNEMMAQPPPAAGRRREAARARAADFPWHRTADETVTQLQLALETANRRP